MIQRFPRHDGGLVLAAETSEPGPVPLAVPVPAPGPGPAWQLSAGQLSAGQLSAGQRLAAAVESAGVWTGVPYAVSPSLGAGGRLLAYVSDADGAPGLWLAPMGERGHRAGPPRRLDVGPGHVASVVFAPDGTRLAAQVAPGGGENTEVVLADVDGSAPPVVVAGGPGRAATLGRWSADGTALAVAESDRSGITTGYLLTVGRPGDAGGACQTIASGVALAVCDVSAHGAFALLRVGPRGRRALVLVELATGRRTPLLGGRLGGVAAARFADVDGVPSLLIQTDALDLGRQAADRVALLAAPLEHPDELRVLAARPDADVERFAASPDGATIALAWNAAGLSELTLLDVASGAVRPLPPLPQAVLTSLLYQPDGRSLLLALDGPRAPGRLWTVEVGAPGGYRCLVAPARCQPETAPAPEPAVPLGMLAVIPTQPETPPLAETVELPVPPGAVASLPRPLAAPELTEPAPIVAVTAEPVRPTLVHFLAGDGLPLDGLLYRPSGLAGPAPMMIHFHGGPEARERPTYNPLFQALVAAGVAVFAPNVRGSSGSGRAFSEADDLERRWDGIADVGAAARYAVDAGLADPALLGIMGRSYGGYLTLAALGHFPDLFQVAIDVCGMYDLVGFYQRTEPWIAASAVTKYGDPDTDADLLRMLSPSALVDRWRTPLLVVHGVNDTNVPFAEGEQAAAAALAAGVPTAFLPIEGEGHEARGREARELFVRECLRWVGEHLLAEAAARLPEAV